ncbi:alkaline phosphatase family protein [Amedibacillus sp. YH-ame10]
MRIPNYEHSIVQVMNTIRKNYGITTYHNFDNDIENWIDQHKFDQIIVLLIDGMGDYQIHEYCDENGFLNTHRLKKIDTVYPPTTVAATTAILTGRMPCSTGWLGWQQYISKYDFHVQMFSNKDFYDNTKTIKRNFSYESFPISTMIDECNKKGIKADSIFPSWRKNGAVDFQDLCNRIVQESKHKNNKFIYAYWDEYDSFMHDYGASHNESIKMLNRFDKILENTMQDLEEGTGLMIIADHGHIDVECKFLIDYPDIIDCLRVLPSFEPRTINFFIKEDKKKLFEKLFIKYFGKDFYLLSKEEVYKNNLFGIGEKNDKFDSLIGDFVACAFHNIQIEYDKDLKLKGNHAGMSNEEIEIPLILYPTE